MIRIIVALILLAVVAVAQPVDGPWLVLQEPAKFITDIHLVQWGDIADIFYIDRNFNTDHSTAHHARFSFTDLEVIGVPDDLSLHNDWTSSIGDVATDGERWMTLVYESEGLFGGSGSNMTRLIRGLDSTDSSLTVDSGYVTAVHPTGNDHSNGSFSLGKRVGGGWLVSWIRNGYYVIGGEGVEPSNTLRVFMLTTDLVMTFGTQCCGNCALYGPMQLHSISLSQDTALAIQQSYSDIDGTFLDLFPMQGDDPCIWIGQQACYNLRLTNGGRILAITGNGQFGSPVRVVQITTDGILSDLGILDSNRTPNAIAWNPNFGFAALFVNSTSLQLTRMDSDGVCVQPKGTIFWADTRLINEANLTVTDNGAVIVLWTEREVDSSRPTVMKMATVGWNTPLATEPRRNAPPAAFALSSFPNPFNPTCTISCSLPRAGEARVSVFDVTGRTVRTLSAGRLSAGEHALTFDGRDLPSGLYFARLESGGSVRTLKMILLK